MKKLYTREDIREIITRLLLASDAASENDDNLIYSNVYREGEYTDADGPHLGKKFESWFNENVPDEAEEGQVSVGVGDGSGKLVVYGDYEAVKTVQDKLLAMEGMYFKEEVKDKFDQFFDYCSEQDAEYNWWYESRLEEWFDENIK